MRFEVPQFIEVEDKIVGPLTWKQFIYVAGGTGLVIILYFSLPFFLFAIFGVPLAALSGFLAFHRINNRPFSVFLESVVNYVTRSRLYLWKRDTQQSIISYSDAYVHAQDTARTVQEGGLNTLAKKLELNTLANDNEN